MTFRNIEIEAAETELRVNDVPEVELWDISDLKEFRVRLVNNGGGADVIDFGDWLKEHGLWE